MATRDAEGRPQDSAVEFWADRSMVGFTPDQLLLAAGWLMGHVEAAADPGTGWFFRLATENFRFGLAMMDQHLVAYRGDQRFGVPVRDPLRFSYRLAWHAELLELRVADRFGERVDAIQTPFTRPPASLLKWARAQRVLPARQPYANAQDAMQTILMQLRGIEEKISSGAWVGFWDAGKPRPERQVNAILHSYVFDTLEVAKSIEVYPEHPSGSGRMDFLFVAPLANGERIDVCAEFKLAHSRELASGLEHQLPEYMASKATAHGIFGVVDFGPPYVPVSTFSFPPVDPLERDLRVEVSLAASHRGIAPVVISVSKPSSPSG